MIRAMLQENGAAMLSIQQRCPTSGVPSLIHETVGSRNVATRLYVFSPTCSFLHAGRDGHDDIAGYHRADGKTANADTVRSRGFHRFEFALCDRRGRWDRGAVGAGRRTDVGRLKSERTQYRKGAWTSRCDVNVELPRDLRMIGSSTPGLGVAIGSPKLPDCRLNAATKVQAIPTHIADGDRRNPTVTWPRPAAVPREPAGSRTPRPRRPP